MNKKIFKGLGIFIGVLALGIAGLLTCIKTALPRYGLQQTLCPNHYPFTTHKNSFRNLFHHSSFTTCSAGKDKAVANTSIVLSSQTT